MVFLYLFFLPALWVSAQGGRTTDSATAYAGGAGRISGDGVSRLSPDAFEAILRGRKKLQLIDTRSSREFSLNHIAEATNIDLLSPDSEEQLAELDRSRPVFIYAIDDAVSGCLAKYLSENGYGEVYVLAGGIVSWIGSDKPYCVSVEDHTSYEAFEKNIRRSDKPVLVEVVARWCTSCGQLQPALDSLSREYGDNLEIVRIDLYSDPGLVSRLKIDAVPTLILYKGKQVSWRKTGPGLFRQEIEKAIASY